MKFFNVLLMLTLVSTTIFGQAEADLKTADKQIKKYYLDPDGNSGALTNAYEAIQSAFGAGGLETNASAQLLKGKILNELAGADFKKKILDSSFKLEYPEAAAGAAMAFMAAHKNAEKKGPKREAMTGLAENENYLNNMGIYAYQDGDFATAFKNFKSSLDLADFLSANGSKSRISNDSIRNEQLFFTAVSAYQGGMKAEAKPFLMKLFEQKTKEIFVYDALFNIANEAGEADATKYLEAGRAVDPNDTSLLFSEINYYLKRGELNVLTDKLKMAIEKEPDNVTVYTTTGSVYDQLAAKAREDGDETKANEYFNEAMGFYNEALNRDANNFDVNYSIGQLYYNKAAALVPAINALSSDITPAGLKKYDAKKAEMDGLFETALPFFQKAESQNGKDLNTIIALKEIYARLNKIDKSNEYKAKYDSLSGGQ